MISSTQQRFSLVFRDAITFIPKDYLKQKMQEIDREWVPSISLIFLHGYFAKRDFRDSNHPRKHFNNKRKHQVNINFPLGFIHINVSDSL